jgi:Flp pilus assembly protein protease CpaA
MTTDRVSASGHPAPRRNAIWPWLVMPVIILALFVVLHHVRRAGGGDDPDATSGVGMP